MSSNAACNSSEGKKVNRRYARENPTILTSVIREEDVESDDNYENEETCWKMNVKLRRNTWPTGHILLIAVREHELC